MSKYGPLARKKIAEELHEYKHHSKYKNRDQAIAAAINMTRDKNGKVPNKSHQ